MSLRTMILAGVGMLVALVLLLLGSIFYMVREANQGRAQNQNLTTDTRSSQFATDAEKVAFLKQYLRMDSAVKSAEFHVVYRDNSTGGVPGPSDWDIQAALKVAPEDLARWTDGMQPRSAAGVDLSWGYNLLPNDARWNVASRPTVYTRQGVTLAVFEPEGIVFKRVSGK